MKLLTDGRPSVQDPANLIDLVDRLVSLKEIAGVPVTIEWNALFNTCWHH